MGDRQRLIQAAGQPGRDRDREGPRAGDALIIDSGWHEIADKALAFVQRFVKS
jgi:hypothetical protein